MHIMQSLLKQGVPIKTVKIQTLKQGVPIKTVKIQVNVPRRYQITSHIACSFYPQFIHEHNSKNNTPQFHVG